MTINTTWLSRILLCLFTLFIVLALSAQEKDAYLWPVNLQKDYSKSYPVGNETIVLANRYGAMKIETWDKNEVKVDVHVSVGSHSNEYAKQALEKISVTDKKEGDRIEYQTQIESWTYDNNGGHEFRIDYVVHLPANAKLIAENNFGPLTIGDYKGESELYCRYGTLTAGKLLNNKSIAVHNGRAKIQQVNEGNVLFRYSRVDIEKLSGKISGGFEYCNSIDIPVDNALTELELKNNYTNLYLMAAKDFSANYDITTNNARVTGKNDIVIKEELANPNTSRTNNFNPVHKYTGSLGKGGGTMINIKSNYGNIRVL